MPTLPRLSISRRARAAKGRIAEIVRRSPEIAERTARFLAADPSLSQMEELMAEPLRKPTQLRLPHEFPERADALLPEVAKDPELRIMGRVSKSALLHLAIGAPLSAEELAGWEDVID